MEKLVAERFFKKKKKKLSISLDQQSEVSQFV